MDPQVSGPKHYTRFTIEPIDFIASNKLDYFQGNVIKYICRYDAKDGIADLRKAQHYLELYIKYLEGQRDEPSYVDGLMTKFKHTTEK